MSGPASRPVPAPVRVPAGTTAAAAVRAAGLPTAGPNTVVVVRDLSDDADGALRDLAWMPEVDVEVAPKIIKAGQRFSRRRFESLDDARKELAEEPYKLELIDLKGGVETSEVMEVVGERNLQLQRIYGTAWESTEALDLHLDRLLEAERRDHRRLGSELDLFSFPDEIGSGLPVFHPKGGAIRREMEDYSRRRHEEAGGRDAEADAVSFRFRDGSQRNAVPVPDAVAAIVDWVGRRDNRSPTDQTFELGGR